MENSLISISMLSINLYQYRYCSTLQILIHVTFFWYRQNHWFSIWLIQRIDQKSFNLLVFDFDVLEKSSLKLFLGFFVPFLALILFVQNGNEDASLWCAKSLFISRSVIYLYKKMIWDLCWFLVGWQYQKNMQFV